MYGSSRTKRWKMIKREATGKIYGWNEGVMWCKLSSKCSISQLIEMVGRT